MNFLLNSNQKNSSFKDVALLSIVTEISFTDDLCRKWENEQMTAGKSFSVLMAFPPYPCHLDRRDRHNMTMYIIHGECTIRATVK